MRYREYKKVDLPWLGEVPRHWEIGKFKRFTSNIGMGRTFLNADLDDYLTEDTIPVYSATQSGKVLGYTSDKSLLLTHGDIVIPARGNSIGYVKLIEEKEATCSQTTIYCKVKDINNKFLYYSCYGFKNEWFRFTDTAIPQITVKQVENNYVPIPPREEQEQIARFLDWKINEIDRLILLKNAKVKKLDKNIQLLIDEGIASIKNYKEIKLKNLGTFLKNGNLSRNDEEKNSKFSALLYGDIYTKYYYIFDEAQTKINKQSYYDNPIINGNTLFFTTSGETREEIGKCVLYTGCEKIAVGGDLVVFKEFDKVDSKYLTYALNTSDAINYRYVNARGEIIIHISQASLGNYKIRVPQMSIQEEISTKIEENIRNNNEIREKVEKQINNLEQLKKSLISDVVTGKIDVRKISIPEYEKVSDIEDGTILEENFNEEV